MSTTWKHGPTRHFRHGQRELLLTIRRTDQSNLRHIMIGYCPDLRKGRVYWLSWIAGFGFRRFPIVTSGRVPAGVEGTQDRQDLST